MRKDHEDLSFDEFDEIVNPRPDETDFDRIVEAAIDRRGFLGGVLAVGSFATLGNTLSALPSEAATNRFAFNQIGTNKKTV